MSDREPGELTDADLEWIVREHMKQVLGVSSEAVSDRARVGTTLQRFDIIVRGKEYVAVKCSHGKWVFAADAASLESRLKADGEVIEKAKEVHRLLDALHDTKTVEEDVAVKNELENANGMLAHALAAREGGGK